ncbi:MAG TPA: hypothetical protein PKH50_01380 [bacterium]|jgi:DNA polymerase III delta subunit|nr:hypothetical protein [bacterium]
MIYIVHGNDISKSRLLIQNQQKKMGLESRLELKISEITPTQLLEKSRSKDLFGNPPFIVLDVSDAGRMDLSPFVEKMKEIPDLATLIILSEKELPKSNIFIKNLQNLKAKLNLNETAPQSNIFNLVDAVFYRQRERAYRELSKLQNDAVSPFEIFSTLLYGLRTIATVKFESPSYKKLSDFVKRKAQAQSKLFSKEQIIDLFEKLRKIDMESKLSEIDEDLLIPMVIETVLNS